MGLIKIRILGGTIMELAVVIIVVILFTSYVHTVKKYKRQLNKLIIQQQQTRDDIDKLGMFVILDNEDKIVQASSQFCEATKYNVTELIGTELKNLVHPDDYKKQTTIAYELRFLTKSDDYKYFECRNFNSINGKVITAIDVTDRTLTENALRTSIEINESLLNSLETKVAAFDKSGKILAINTIFKESIDKEATDLDNICMHNPIVTENVDKVLSNQLNEVQFECQIDEKWYHVKIAACYMGGTIYYKDITKTAELDENLKSNELAYKQLMDRIPCALFATNTFGITYCNTEAQKLLKISDDTKILGDAFIDYIKFDTRREFVAKYFNKNVGAVSSTQVMVDMLGNEINVEISRSKTIIEGKVADIYLVRDLSDQYKAQLYREAIAQKDMELDESRLKTEFFVNVSHDFRTPINVISSAAQLMALREIQQEYESGAVDKYVDIIKHNCTRLLRLVNNIIDMTKIESGFYNLNKMKYNIVNVVEEITLSIIPYVESKAIELVFDTDIEECIVDVDIDSIERVVMNLLSNAVKFTPVGGKIEVEIYQQFPNVVISVSDTGMGIANDKLTVIFERFKQAENVLNNKEEGSGIGLSLVKSLIEMQDGTVDVESVIGQGSNFKITLPALSANLGLEDLVYEGDNREKVNMEFSDIYLPS